MPRETCSDVMKLEDASQRKQLTTVAETILKHQMDEDDHELI